MALSVICDVQFVRLPTPPVPLAATAATYGTASCSACSPGVTVINDLVAGASPSAAWTSLGSDITLPGAAPNATGWEFSTPLTIPGAAAPARCLTDVTSVGITKLYVALPADIPYTPDNFLQVTLANSFVGPGTNTGYTRTQTVSSHEWRITATAYQDFFTVTLLTPAPTTLPIITVKTFSPTTAANGVDSVVVQSSAFLGVQGFSMAVGAPNDFGGPCREFEEVVRACFAARHAPLCVAPAPTKGCCCAIPYATPCVPMPCPVLTNVLYNTLYNMRGSLLSSSCTMQLGFVPFDELEDQDTVQLAAEAANASNVFFLPVATANGSYIQVGDTFELQANGDQVYWFQEAITGIIILTFLSGDGIVTYNSLFTMSSVTLGTSLPETPHGVCTQVVLMPAPMPDTTLTGGTLRAYMLVNDVFVYYSADPHPTEHNTITIAFPQHSIVFATGTLLTALPALNNGVPSVGGARLPVDTGAFFPLQWTIFRQ